MLDIGVALIGNPNVGKTSLFNALTGARRMSVTAGVTIGKTGTTFRRKPTINITDLPGIYSMSAVPDEAVANEFITTADIVWWCR